MIKRCLFLALTFLSCSPDREETIETRIVPKPGSIEESELTKLETKVYFMSSNECELVQSSYDQTDIDESIDQANLILLSAGLEIDVIEYRNFNTQLGQAFCDFYHGGDTSGQTIAALKALLPPTDKTTFNVILIKESRSTGVYLGESRTVVMGEIDNRKDPLELIDHGTVLAHEFGHALGLAHNNIAGNLMGRKSHEDQPTHEVTDLTDNQIQAIQNQAIKGPVDFDSFSGKGVVQ